MSSLTVFSNILPVKCYGDYKGHLSNPAFQPPPKQWSSHSDAGMVNKYINEKDRHGRPTPRSYYFAGDAPKSSGIPMFAKHYYSRLRTVGDLNLKIGDKQWGFLAIGKTWDWNVPMIDYPPCAAVFIVAIYLYCKDGFPYHNFLYSADKGRPKGFVVEFVLQQKTSQPSIVSEFWIQKNNLLYTYMMSTEERWRFGEKEQQFYPQLSNKVLSFIIKQMTVLDWDDFFSFPYLLDPVDPDKIYINSVNVYLELTGASAKAELYYLDLLSQVGSS